MDTKSKWLWVIQSRKFWAAVIGLVLVVLTSWDIKPFPIDAVVTAVMGIVAAYMGATALEDGLSQRDSGTTKISAPTSSNVTVVASAQPQDVAQVAPTGAIGFKQAEGGSVTVKTAE